MERKGAGGVTFNSMGCDPAETARRQGVCVRLNILWHKRQNTDDTKKVKRIDREIDRIRRTEAAWMKEAAYFLY